MNSRSKRKDEDTNTYLSREFERSSALVAMARIQNLQWDNDIEDVRDIIELSVMGLYWTIDTSEH